MLFSAPLVILLLAAGVGAMAEWLARRQPKIPWLAFAGLALAVTPVLDAARQIREPFAREAIGALIPWVVQTHAPGSAIYIPGRTVHSWLFYTTDWQAPDTARIARTCRLVCFGGPAFYLAPTRGDSIVAEGDAYHYRYHDWDELIGIPPGFGPDDKSVKRSVPDPGWEANEVRRMLDVSSSELWLVSSTYYPGYLDPLAAPLERAGAIVLERRIAPGASATRYRLPEGREAATVSRGN
jgi:hypothetical protein